MKKNFLRLVCAIMALAMILSLAAQSDKNPVSKGWQVRVLNCI